MPLYPKQVEAVQFFRRLARGINTAEFGCGKTQPTIVRLRELVPPKRALGIVPAPKIDDWLKEIAAWGRRDWVVSVLGGHRIKRRWHRVRAFRRPHNIALINPEGVLVMGEALLGQYEVLFVDEAHAVAKNPYAQTSRALAVLSDDVQHVLCMTGAPLTEHLTDLYGLFRLVNPGMVDRTFEPWRDRYFVFESRDDPATGRRGYPKWHAREGTLEVLSQALQAVSFRYTRKEMPVDWPQEIDARPLVVKMHNDERRLYESMERDCRIVLKNVDVSAENVRPRLMKLLQICSGWVYNEKKRPILLGASAKLEALRDHVEEVRRGGKILVWAVYPPEINLIGRMLTGMGVTHALCHGKVDQKDREMSKAAFNDGYIQALVANPDIWAPGVNLYADFATTFSRNWSGDTHGQKRGRPIRADSKQERVVFTEIVAWDTVDAACLAALEAKKDLLQAVLQMRTVPRG